LGESGEKVEETSQEIFRWCSWALAFIYICVFCADYCL